MLAPPLAPPTAAATQPPAIQCMAAEADVCHLSCSCLHVAGIAADAVAVVAMGAVNVAASLALAALVVVVLVSGPRGWGQQLAQH